MAVVTTLSDLIHNSRDLAKVPSDPQQNRGRLVLATGIVANEATDNTLSKYKLVEIPADALVHEDTFFDVENWGFAQIVIGTETDTTALIDQTKATENIVTPFAVGDANHAKRWWEVLGLAERPAGNVEIWAHAAADATGAGAMPFRIAYIAP